ncbi:ZZ-type zinc finger-containing protein 3 [Aphidius gifuensis]|uniref:ZZ-type zinc finger-containing protein 3 n=1 Tax=Aphidius gifuensis TaxID=684658 RepID=UPI001CDBA04F|nr:ZZ-type zinc finger-containing protein 3 [Aphidius gifuensis]
METITEENIKIEEEEEDENSEFYFESDHLALRNNKDYLSLLKTVVTLEALRIKSLEDLDTLISWRKKALDDPLSFAKQLQDGCHLELPGSRKIPDIPKIDFSQYTVYGSDTRMGPQTRPKEPAPVCEKKIDDNKRLVRGRIFDDSKPETFNQPWTDEEQMRLDRLLEKYPEETIQMRRWTKIANELGNRTPKQVSSRVQKYEIKLKQVALTFRKGIKSETSTHSRLGKRKRRGNRASTFFPYKEFDNCENHDDVDDNNMDIDKNNCDNSIDGVSSNPSGYCDDSNSSERSDNHTQRVYSHIEMLQRIKK